MLSRWPVWLYVVPVKPLVTAAPLRSTVYLTPDVAEAIQPRLIWLEEAAVAVRLVGATGLSVALAQFGQTEDEHTAWTAGGLGEAERVVEHLTARETVVLRLMAIGFGNKEIASRLDISEHTAKFHVSSILAKLGATSRTDAVTIGIMRAVVAI